MIHRVATADAVAAARAVAAGLGLPVDDAVVLNDSNRLVVRLLPCDVVARVTPPGHFASAEGEVELGRRLGDEGSPVIRLDPRVPARVLTHDGYRISLWSHVEPSRRPLRAADYAEALGRLHAGLRRIDHEAPHVFERVAATRRDAVNPDATPELSDEDRVLLVRTLDDAQASIRRRTTSRDEQLLHGEPHAGNVLATTADGPLFFDFENACRGPVEYDLGWVSEEVVVATPGADRELVDAGRALVLAIIATHRWTAGDRHPSGRSSGVAFLDVLRAGPPWPPIDAVRWTSASKG